MDKEQEIINLINTAKSEDVKNELKLMLNALIRLRTVVKCEICGCSFKYYSKSKHLRSVKHTQSLKNGIKYVPPTSNFQKKREELDTETYERKKEYHRKKYHEYKRRVPTLQDGENLLP